MKRLTLAALSLIISANAAHASAPICQNIFVATNTQATRAEDVDALMRKAVTSGPLQKMYQSAAQSALNLDERNFIYYLALFGKNQTAVEKEMIKLFPARDSNLIAYPVGATATPKEIAENFQYVQYDAIKKSYTGRHAKTARVIIQKMQAGTGSSMTRQTYLETNSSALGLAKDGAITLGAKGTDLLVTIPHPQDVKNKVSKKRKVKISIVEFQILQAIQSAERGLYREIVLQDIVGPETQKRLDKIWQKKSLIDPNLSYRELFEKVKGTSSLPSIYQSHVPSLNEDLEVSFKRYAPAGHGLFAVANIVSAYRNKQSEIPTITAIANGEDVNSLPDEVMIDWMVRESAPIALVTTDKTAIDVKGGILCLVKDERTGELYLKVLETAEAKAAGQQAEYEKQDGLASTNLTLFNNSVLANKLKGISENELLRAIAPDLILNWKEQKDEDGITRKYLQLEGAMGSVIMNLDRYFRKTGRGALVHVINVSTKERTNFFAPIKSAFDYWMQFHSDRFKIDPLTLKLHHLRGKDLPKIAFYDPSTKDKYYQDVQNILETFEGTSILNLNELTLTGKVSLKGLILEGALQITNQTDSVVALEYILTQPKFQRFINNDSSGRLVLSDLDIQITAAGIAIKKL